MSVGFFITFIGLLTRRYIEQTPSGPGVAFYVKTPLQSIPGYSIFNVTLFCLPCLRPQYPQ
jgi:hypothetical protein